MTSQEPAPQDEMHEQLARLTAFLRRAVRFWRAPVAFLVLGGVACAAFLALRHPSYRSETVILYSEGIRPADDQDRPDNARSITVRLKEILMSRSALDAVVMEFDLYPDVQRTRGPLDAVEELRKHVEFRAPGGDTFSVAFTGQSPSEAQQVTSKLAGLVIGQDSDLRKKQAQATLDFLETEKRTTTTSLRDAELGLASFMAAHPRFALDSTPLATGAAIRASLGLPTAASSPSGARPRWLGSAGGNALPLSGSPAVSPSIGEAGRDAAAEEARARAALAAAQANLTDLSTHFTSAHPDVRAANAEVQRETTRLAAATAAAATARTASPGRMDPAPAPAIVVHPPPVVTVVGDAPTARPTANSATDHDVVALETEWVKLTRAVTEARQHEDQVEAALFKASSAVSSENGGHGVQVSVIDPAFRPVSPVPPGRVVIAALFLVGSLLLGLLVAFGRALLDDRIYEGRDLGAFAELLSEIPRSSSRRTHVAG